MATEQKYAVGVMIAAAVVFVGSFLPWGEVHQNMGYSVDDFTFDIAPFLPSYSTITAWNSHIVLLVLPNWLVVIAAAGVVVCCTLRATHVWQAPPIFMVVLASYGLIHSSMALIMLLTYGN